MKFDHDSLKGQGLHKLKLQPNKRTGYIQVPLMKDGKFCIRTIHRLVASAFVPNPDAKPEVNHVNGDKADNTAGNLEWVTHKENMRHSFFVLGNYEKMRPARLESLAVKKQQTAERNEKARQERLERHKVICIETRRSL